MREFVAFILSVLGASVVVTILLAIAVAGVHKLTSRKSAQKAPA